MEEHPKDDQETPHTLSVASYLVVLRRKARAQVALRANGRACRPPRTVHGEPVGVIPTRVYLYGGRGILRTLYGVSGVTRNLHTQ